jgi:glycosyltransferase involved in cell wall biosynthesis
MRVIRILGTLEPGGAQLSALRLSVALRGLGIATTLLAGDATPAGLDLAARYGLAANACRISDVVAPESLQWTPEPSFASWLGPRLAGADLVHAHMAGAWWAAAQALPRHVPLAASEHNQMTWPGADHTPQARQAARRVGLFFAHGPAAREWAALIGLDDGRLHEGRSSVEGLSAEPLPGLPSPRLTFTGRLRGDKAPDVLVEALALLHRPPPTYLVGEGPLRGALIRQIQASGLQAVVHLPGWSYDPARYVAGASVHVVPSREEAWSQSAVLGLGLGVPVVGTAVDGLARTLGEGRGVLVPPEAPDALAAALSRILDGKQLDPAPGLAYARQFTPSAVAAAYADAYRQLIASWASRPEPRGAAEPAQTGG